MRSICQLKFNSANVVDFFLLFIVDISALVQIFLILFISEGENLVESLLIFCKRPNCIKDILLRSYRPNTATQADNKSFVKSQRLAEALKPVSSFYYFFPVLLSLVL